MVTLLGVRAQARARVLVWVLVWEYARVRVWVHKQVLEQVPWVPFHMGSEVEIFN